MRGAAGDLTGPGGDRIAATGDNRESSCDRFADRPFLHTTIIGWAGLIPAPVTLRACGGPPRLFWSS